MKSKEGIENMENSTAMLADVIFAYAWYARSVGIKLQLKTQEIIDGLLKATAPRDMAREMVVYKFTGYKKMKR